MRAPGLGTPRDRHRQPGIDVLPGLRRRQRLGQRPRVGHDAQERRKGQPRQRDALHAVERLLQPRPSAVVHRTRLVHRVQQDVRVDEHQRLSRPSSASRASATEETSTRIPSALVLLTERDLGSTLDQATVHERVHRFGDPEALLPAQSLDRHRRLVIELDRRSHDHPPHARSRTRARACGPGRPGAPWIERLDTAAR